MLIRIASTRTPKVNGVRRAVEKLAVYFQSIDSPRRIERNIRFETIQIESGVADTPKSIEELMRGAQQRSQAVYEEQENETVLSVGVEGGLFRVGEKVFLQSWSCVYDGEEYFFGSSGSIEIPSALADVVMKNGADLGTVIDGFAEKIDVRSHQGTFGILTNDLITREDSFELATINALVPFFNRTVYKKNLSGESYKSNRKQRLNSSLTAPQLKRGEVFPIFA